MKKTIRILSLLLALLMLTSTFVACNVDDSKTDDTTASTQGVDSKELPEMNWEGQEYRILGRESTTEWAQSFEVDRDELPEDVVGKAVYERNQGLYEKYGIDIVGTLVSNTTSTAKTMLESGEDLYDMIILSPEAHHPLATSGYLLDMYTLDYVNMEHDGWQDYANTQLTMGGRLYYTTNKFLVQDKNRTWAMFYNRNMAKELNLGHFEDFVFDGSWTVDKLVELGNQATADSDGQVGMSLADTWGVAAADSYNFCQFAYGVGFRLTDHGTDGYPTLIGATDRIVQLLDKVYTLTANREVYYCDAYYGTTDWSNCADQAFTDGRVLALAIPISALPNMSEQSDFTIGVLPNPKYNEEQEDYYAIPNLGNGSLFSVPATVVDTSFTGFALQALTEASVDSTYTAYIETKCKLQEAYDEDAARCMDIIFDGVVYDIAFVSNIAGLGTMVGSTLSNSQTNTYTRLYKSLEKIASKQINKIKADYAAIG